MSARVPAVLQVPNELELAMRQFDNELTAWLEGAGEQERTQRVLDFDPLKAWQRVVNIMGGADPNANLAEIDQRIARLRKLSAH